MSTKACRTPLMIKPVTNMCVRYLAKSSRVWLGWLLKMYFNLRKTGKKMVKFSMKSLLMMMGNWPVRKQLEARAPPFISCLLLWLLKAHYTSYHIIQCVGFGGTSCDSTPLPFGLWQSFRRFLCFCLEPSIWSLHMALLSLLYIRTNGMMPLFPWANPSCAHCWPASSVRVYIVCLYVVY